MNMTVYFLLDCSASMYGERADMLNLFMDMLSSDIFPEILIQKNSDMKIKISVLGFSGARNPEAFYMLPKLELEEFCIKWRPLGAKSFDGDAPVGAAIEAVIYELNDGHGDRDPDAVAPLILLISDGSFSGRAPTYEDVLQYAVKGGDREDTLFRRSLKIAVGINADEEGRQNLKRFGRVSHMMERRGISTYYDWPEQGADFFMALRSILCPWS